MPTNRYNNLSAAAYWWLMTALVAVDSVVIFFDGWFTKSVFARLEAPELNHCQQYRQLVHSKPILILVAHPPAPRHYK